MVSKFDAAQQNQMQARYYSGYSNCESVVPTLKEIQKEHDAIERITFLGKILYPEDDLEQVLLNLTDCQQAFGFVEGLSQNKMTHLRHLVPGVKCVLERNPNISVEQKDLITFALESLKGLLDSESKASEARKAAGIGAHFVESEYTIPRCLKPSVFSWGDIAHLLKANLWFRKPSSRQAGESDIQAAEREKKQGVQGDVLCISGMGLSNLIQSHSQKEKHSISFKDDSDLFETHNSIKERLKHFNETEKKEIVAAFEQALISFIYRYTLCGAMIGPEDPIEGYFEKRIEVLLDRSQYLLILENDDYPTEPYDFHHYFQLGKRGKGYIPPEMIKESIAADRASLSEVLSMDQLDFTQKMVELSKRTVEGVLKSLKECIHAY